MASKSASSIVTILSTIKSSECTVVVTSLPIESKTNKATYIQSNSSAKRNIFTDFGIATKSMPEMQLDAKDLFKRDWAEQQGDDEYIPSYLRFKAFDTAIEFVFMGTLGTAATQIRAFISYLSQGEFSIYDEFSQRGFRCRFAGYDNTAFHRVDKDVVVFKVKVKVNNPLSYVATSLPVVATQDMDIYFDDGVRVSYISGATISKPVITFAIINPTKL